MPQAPAFSAFATCRRLAAPTFAAVCLFAGALGSTLSASPKDDRIQWWREARFGLFVHWGLYAIPGRGEWVQWNEQIPVDEYAKLAERFQPKDFSPAAWTELAREAGAKYMVLTSRHHDGFALFADPGNPFTSVATAARRDFVAEFTEAARKTGLRVGLYYSPLDWRFPGYLSPDLQRSSAEAMREQYHRQMRELLGNYGKIDILWFDGGETDWLNFGADWLPGGQWKKRPREQHYRGGFSWQHEKVHELLRKLQPDIVVNGRADMEEDFRSREGYGALGKFDNQHPWELCVPIAGAWGYQPKLTPKPLKDYIQLLAMAAGRDGNLLINVGPDPDGKIDPLQAERLREIGAWLAKYGESIYATRGGPFLPGAYGVSTHRGNTVYLHLLGAPANTLRLPAFAAKVLRASVTTGGEAEIVRSASGVELRLTGLSPDAPDTIVKLELDAPASTLGTLPFEGPGA